MHNPNANINPPTSRLRQIKPSPRIHRIEQLLPQHTLTPIPRQLQQIDTSTRTRQPRLILTTIPNTESRVQTRETQQRRSWGTRYEFEDKSFLGIRKCFHDVPEALHGGVFEAIVANDVDTAVLGVAPEVGDVY